jgi:pimeloyl-ACP methyl ester carboxylesterase
VAETPRTTPPLAFDDSGGDGPLVVLLPGAGDLRTEHRFLVPPLVEAGYRAVIADLPGHGDSPTARSYGVAETAAALVGLVDRLGAGPAAVVACSFSPAAAVWAAADRPDAFSSITLISPHLEADESLRGRMQRLAISGLLRGRWAAGIWARLYRGWYHDIVPADLDRETAGIRQMLDDPERRRAVRETLVASRAGITERMGTLRMPSVVVFGDADDHFADPSAEAASLAERLGGRGLVVPGAGHYPHVEQPGLVATVLLELLEAA